MTTYKFIQKTELDQRTTIGDQTFNKGQTVFTIHYKDEDSSGIRETTMHLNRDIVKNMLQLGVKIQGLKLDAVGRIIEDKTKSFEDMAYNVINNMHVYLKSLGKAGGTFTYKPSLYDGTKGSLTNVFDILTFRLLRKLFENKDFNFETINDQMTGLLENIGWVCNFGLCCSATKDGLCCSATKNNEDNEDNENYYKNRFECSRPEQVLDMIADAVRFKIGYRYNGDIAQFDIDDIATDVLIDNLEQYLDSDSRRHFKCREMMLLQYVTGYVKIPNKGSNSAAYKELVDYMFYDECIESSPRMNLFIIHFLEKDWTLTDEINKHKKSVKIFKHIGAEYERRTGTRIPGTDGYLDPKPYIKNIVEKVKKTSIYRCDADEHAALVSLIASTNAKNLELTDPEVIRIKSLGIEVDFGGRGSCDDFMFRTVVKYIGN